MWTQDWRDEIWRQLDQPWDMLIAGGGISGAGILREATRAGLRALLVEQNDFASGTSSRSSKLVHGGLRYLREGKVGLTLASVREREQLLDEGAGLVKPLGFLLATYRGERPGRLVYRAGLSLYDLLAWQWSHRYYDPADFHQLAPHLTTRGLKGGFNYGDAQTDDARLVLRVLREAVAAGGTAINYFAAESLLTGNDGQVIGVRLYDRVADRRADVYATAVVSATGAWADQLRGQVGGEKRLRPLRGSHLIFPGWRLPVAQAISFGHPFDGRPVFAFPWQGITLVGTTDVDHDQSLAVEPRISPEETAYLMAAVQSHFPALNLTLDDVTATLAGVRPVVGTGRVDPSRESRDHVVWEESGLLTVTGGKLTTFQVIAHDTLRALRSRLPEMAELDARAPALDPVEVALPPAADELDTATRLRLLGWYTTEAPALIDAAQPGELRRIPGAELTWAELRWAARAEAVVHLDDLLLRRVRLGLLLPQGGAAEMDRIRAICQPELGWDDQRWAAEAAAYEALWQAHYSLPERALIPDWQPRLAALEQRRAELAARRGRSPRPRRALLALLLLAVATLLWRRWAKA